MDIHFSQEGASLSPKINKYKRWGIVVAVTVFVLYIIYSAFVGSLFSFENPVHVQIKSGDSLKTVALKLEEAGVVTSSSLFSTSVMLLGGESNIVTGIYSFEKRAGTFLAAKRLIAGKTNIKATRITFPEGFTSAQMSKRLFELLLNFDADTFSILAKEKEGFLFPDTYFFLPNATPEEVVERLEETFWVKVEEKFGWTKENIDTHYKSLVLASILEEEVRGSHDKRIVADIFLRRMKIGMPLQADSTLAYITGRDSLSLTVDDLKSDSPFNSYTNKGLPPTPISNPGLESIEAALNPEPNKYLYFLTDEEGKVYYAKTFEEHKQNKVKYLR